MDNFLLYISEFIENQKRVDMRVSWVIVLFFGVIIAMSLPQRMLADEAKQQTQLGIAAGLIGITVPLKMPLATDAALKPGDFVNLYQLWQKRARLSDNPLIRDTWVAEVAVKNIKVIAIDRSEPLDSSASYVRRMVRLEVGYETMRRFPYREKTYLDDYVIGLVGDPVPNICGDCDVVSKAEGNGQSGRECFIKTRSGSRVTKVRIPCPKDE